MHILVIVDLFSRWSQLYPLKTLTADEAATALLHYVTTFGTPSNITSDNGTQFINDTVKDLSALLDIIPIPIVPYNHQENGIVENRNRYIRRLLEASQPGKEKDYQLACALTTRALNSREHSTLGLAPADIQFGMHNRLDKNLFPMELSDQREPDSWVTHYYDVIKKQDEMLGNSRVSLARAQQRHARTLKPPQPNPFNKGDWILVENDSHQSLKTGDDKRDGPFKVLSTTDDSISYESPTFPGRIFTAPLAKITKYTTRPGQNPYGVTLRNNAQYFIIERILGHRVVPAKKDKPEPPRVNNTQFHVKWLNYPDPEWQSISDKRGSIRETSQFKRYILDHHPDLEHLLPPLRRKR
jgi:hypothetical protein